MDLQHYLISNVWGPAATKRWPSWKKSTGYQIFKYISTLWKDFKPSGMILAGGLKFDQDDSYHETHCVPGSEPQKKPCIAESDLAPHVGLQLLLLQNSGKKKWIREYINQQKFSPYEMLNWEQLAFLSSFPSCCQLFMKYNDELLCFSQYFHTRICCELSSKISALPTKILYLYF